MKKIFSILLGTTLLTACSPATETQDLEQLATSCAAANGNWLAEYKECENVPKEWCDTEGGVFEECGSACRHDPMAEICTMQCVIFCKF